MGYVFISGDSQDNYRPITVYIRMQGCEIISMNLLVTLQKFLKTLSTTFLKNYPFLMKWCIDLELMLLPGGCKAMTSSLTLQV